MPDPTATKYAAYLAIHRTAGTTPRSYADWRGEYERAQYVLTAQQVKDATSGWHQPSKAQIEAGNYTKPTINWNGLRIKIENPRGTKRRPEWKPLAHHYGYIARTEDRDGDAVDCYVGPHLESEIVFVVDQEHPSGRFDEHKVCLAFRNAAEARKGYLDNYQDGWHCGPITAMTIDQFKAWLDRGDTKTRVAEQVSRYTAKSTTPAHDLAPDAYDQLAEQLLIDRYARKHLKSSAGQQSLHFESAAPVGRHAWTEEDERKHPREPDGEWAAKGEESEKPAPRPKATEEPDRRLQDHVANLHDAMQERLVAGKQFLARHAGKPLWISSGDHVRVADDKTTLEHTDPDGKWVRADLAQLDHWADKAGVQPFTGPEGILTSKEADDARTPDPARTTAPQSPATPDPGPGKPLAPGNRAGPEGREGMGGGGPPEGKLTLEQQLAARKAKTEEARRRSGDTAEPRKSFEPPDMSDREPKSKPPVSDLPPELMTPRQYRDAKLGTANDVEILRAIRERKPVSAEAVGEHGLKHRIPDDYHLSDDKTRYEPNSTEEPNDRMQPHDPELPPNERHEPDGKRPMGDDRDRGGTDDRSAPDREGEGRGGREGGMGEADSPAGAGEQPGALPRTGPAGEDVGEEPPAADQDGADEPPEDEAQPEGPAGDALDQLTHRDIDDMVKADSKAANSPDKLRSTMLDSFRAGLKSGRITQAQFDEMVRKNNLTDLVNKKPDSQQDARYQEYLDQTKELDQLLGNYYPLSRQEWDRAGLGEAKYEETKQLMEKRLAFARETRQKQDAAKSLERNLGQFAQHKGVLYQRKEGPRGPEWTPVPGEQGYPIGHETMMRHAQAGDATPVKLLEVQLWIQKKLADLKSKATVEQRRKMEAIEQTAKRETSREIIMDRPPPGGWTEADKVPEQPERIRHRTAEEQHGAPWQHTRKEWDQLAGGSTGHHHTSAVQLAIRAGEPVPDRVIDSEESFQIAKAYADIDKEFTSEQHALMDRPTTELTEEQFLQQASLKSLRDNKRQIIQYDRELKGLGPKAKKDRENREMWKRLAQDSIKRIESGEDLEKNREYRRQKYRDTIKQAISRGLVTDPQIIAQYPEFKLARTARERYEKGRHTSFANRSIAVDDSMQGQHGYKVKRQDGKPITPEQRDEIHRGIQEIHQAVGDLTDLYRHTDVTLAHTSGKHPFLSQIGGCYHPSDKSVTFGTNILGILPIRAQAHELGHWLDYEAGRAMGWQGKAHLYSANWKSRGRGHVVDTTAVSQFQSQNPRDPASTELFRIAADHMNDEREVRRLTTAKLKDAETPEQKAEIEKAKVVLGPYWHSPHEIFARLFEQYVADQNGNRPDLVSTENRYATSAGYWAPEVWQRIKPLVEKEIQRRIALIRGAIPKEGTPDDQ